MNKLTICILVVFLMAVCGFAQGAGTAQVYSVSGDRTDAGLRLGYDTLHTTAGASFEGGASSIDAGVGGSIGGVRINVGVGYFANNENEEASVSVAGVPSLGVSNNGDGVGVFVEAKWGFVYVRHVATEEERTYWASRTVGYTPAPASRPIIKRGSINSTDRRHYTSVGITFPF